MALALAGCDGAETGKGSARTAAAETLREQLMVVPATGPQIVVSDEAGLARAERFARTLDPAATLARVGARSIRADSLAWLTGSEPGRAFLAADPPRALARGEPAENCPATGAATGADAAAGDEATRRGRVARRALERCLAALEDRPGGCSCRLIAIDRVLTVPVTEMAYATGITARLRAPDLGIDGVLIAEEEGDGTILLRDIRGIVARLEREGESGAVLSFAEGGLTMRGRREAVGWRRGRLAERIYLQDDRGRRAALLIGFSPGELARGAGAGLAWPQGG